MQKENVIFQKDVLVKTETASHNDYINSGYDRGHLLPAADMKWSQLAVDETFLMSTVSPQNPSFNRNGLWRKLETKVREWVVSKEELAVVAGGVLTDGLPNSLNQKVSVPKCYFKIILDKKDFSSVSFLLENTSISGLLSDFVVSIDSIEQLTDIDFFNSLPDSLENSIEKNTALSDWF